jgi:hypothetical protein
MEVEHFQYLECQQNGIERRSPELPNPAVYALETNLAIPIRETLLPVAKRILMRQTA